MADRLSALYASFRHFEERFPLMLATMVEESVDELLTAQRRS
jgi:hypothetical protein